MPIHDTSPPSSTAGTVLIEAEEIVKRFPVGRTLFGKPRRWLHAVDGVSLTVNRGETVGLVGKSGCGKSTMGRLLIRTLEPDSGKLSFNGEDITMPTEPGCAPCAAVSRWCSRTRWDRSTRV